MKISGAFDKILNISKIECRSTFKPPFACLKVTITVIVRPIWCFQLQKEAQIGKGIKILGAVLHFL